MFYVIVTLITLSAFVGLNCTNWIKATITSQTVWLCGILSVCDEIKDHGPTVNNASRRKCEYQLLFLSPIN